VKLVTNPILLHAAVVLFCAGFAFLLGLICIRLLRKSITEEADFSTEATPSLETLPLHLYNTVIQQLKQQKHELDVQSKSEQQRARISETLSQAVLSNLSSGVLVFGTNGLVKTSNPAAKEILGFASATGMSASDIFRGAIVTNSIIATSSVFPDETPGDLSADCVHLADEVDAVLHQGSKRRQAHAEYETPAGESRFLAVTISAVPAADGSLLGVACLINDQSELEDVRRQQELQGELSAERALELRTSLTTISGYAQQLACNRDPEIARQLAADIAQESARLDRSIGGFLTQRPAAPGVPQSASATSGAASGA
jgi:nitrogen fixation/metabolism regulation signal transduction histidine kinase